DGTAQTECEAGREVDHTLGVGRLHTGEVDDDRYAVAEELADAAGVPEAVRRHRGDPAAVVLGRLGGHPDPRIGHPRLRTLGALAVVGVLLVVVALAAVVVDEAQPGARPSNRTHGRLLSRARSYRPPSHRRP